LILLLFLLSTMLMLLIFQSGKHTPPPPQTPLHVFVGVGKGVSFPSSSCLLSGQTWKWVCVCFYFPNVCLFVTFGPCFHYP
jgi:hypothetical protein